MITHSFVCRCAIVGSGDADGQATTADCSCAARSWRSDPDPLHSTTRTQPPTRGEGNTHTPSAPPLPSTVCAPVRLGAGASARGQAHLQPCSQQRRVHVQRSPGEHWPLSSSLGAQTRCSVGQRRV